jgi:hypothetical protein
MKTLIDKLSALEQDVSEEKAPFKLFGLFLREDASEKWDLVVAAPWLEKDKRAGLEYLTSRLRSILSDKELLSLSRVVLLDESDPAFQAIVRAIRVQHGRAEIRDSSFSGLEIKHGFLVTSTGT